MKQMKKDLKAVTRDLKKLSRKTDIVIKQLVQLEKIRAANKLRSKKTKTAAKIDPVLARVMRDKIHPIDIILGLIIGNAGGIDVNTLTKKTGYNDRKIKNIIFRLKKEEKIRSDRKVGLRGTAYGLGKSRTLYFEK